MGLIYYNTVTYRCFTLPNYLRFVMKSILSLILNTTSCYILHIFTDVAFYFATNNFFLSSLQSVFGCGNVSDVEKGFYTFFYHHIVHEANWCDPFGLVSTEAPRVVSKKKVKRQNWMKDLIPSFCMKMIVSFFRCACFILTRIFQLCKKKQCEENIFAFYI